jgi:murein DD-endopeptidase MepM/ murein hydrolase activator NlpD
MSLALSSFPLLVPRDGRISFHDGFGDNRHRMAHDAIDLGAPQGTLVLCAADGVVLHGWMSGHGSLTGVGWSPRGGFIATILDGARFIHCYAHMRAAPNVEPGQTVRAGGILGQVSNSGSIAHGGPMHLHYQVCETGTGRDAERISGTFTRRFDRAVNPYAELARLARGLGARVQTNGHVAM